MRKRQGFTLVELLVVMAIIAILAAIVVPNAAKFIARARVTRALSEVSGMETAIMAMVTDAGRSTLGQIFDMGQVPGFVAGFDGKLPSGKDGVSRAKWQQAAAGNLSKATEIYTSVVYDLLQNGRNAITSGASPATTVINRNVLSKLGTNYMDLGNDPWGTPYQILAGPWNVSTPPVTNSNVPIYFRKFSVDPSNAGGTGSIVRQPKMDAFRLKDGGNPPNYIDEDPTINSIVGDDGKTWPDKVGFPADVNKSVYIWSFGENMRNSQMMYTLEFDPNVPATWYPGAQDGTDLGGGDDINNWDKESSWARFTN